MESQNIVTPVIQLKLNLSAMSTHLFNLHKAAKKKKLNCFHIVKSTAHYKQTFTAL